MYNTLWPKDEKQHVSHFKWEFLKTLQACLLSRTIFDWNWLPQPLVLSGSVETFKAAISSRSIKYLLLIYETCE
jgi:hypothetical protein